MLQDSPRPCSRGCFSTSTFAVFVLTLTFTLLCSAFAQPKLQVQVKAFARHRRNQLQHSSHGYRRNRALFVLGHGSARRTLSGIILG